jgi:hypothetical protein
VESGNLQLSQAPQDMLVIRWAGPICRKCLLTGLLLPTGWAVCHVSSWKDTLKPAGSAPDVAGH